MQLYFKSVPYTLAVVNFTGNFKSAICTLAIVIFVGNFKSASRTLAIVSFTGNFNTVPYSFLSSLDTAISVQFMDVSLAYGSP